MFKKVNITGNSFRCDQCDKRKPAVVQFDYAVNTPVYICLHCLIEAVALLVESESCESL